MSRANGKPQIEGESGMSYDLMVFEKTKAPDTREAFMAAVILLGIGHIGIHLMHRKEAVGE